MSRIFKVSTATALVLLLVIAGAGLTKLWARADGGQPKLPVINININNATLEVEIANVPKQRYHGLSKRKTLAENAAMLFVYQREEKLLFTMRDTTIPLSIAFVDKDFRINEILDMQPLQDGPFPAQYRSKYALETRQGWFTRNNVDVGDLLVPEKPIPAGR